MVQPLVAVSSDVKEFEKYRWHAATSIYLEAVFRGAGVLPVIVPSLGADYDLDALLDHVDGVVLTGSKSNVHPSLYGGDASDKNGPYDSDRDATSFPLIRKSIKRGIPLLAICRGMQELNVALGGTLDTEIQEMDGRDDHRAPPSENQDERFAIRQDVKVSPGGCIERYLGDGILRVNSIHRQAIGQKASTLVPEAVAPDGTIEAVSVNGAKAFAVGVQWHPEYWYRTDDTSRRIFSAFGDAVRGHADARNPIKSAAE